MLFSAIGSLGTALFGVLWWFFRRLHTRFDKLSDNMHSMEVRITEKIERLDREHDEIKKDLGKLFTQVGKLEGYVHGQDVHKRRPSTYEEHNQ